MNNINHSNTTNTSSISEGYDIINQQQHQHLLHHQPPPQQQQLQQQLHQQHHNLQGSQFHQSPLSSHPHPHHSITPQLNFALLSSTSTVDNYYNTTNNNNNGHNIHTPPPLPILKSSLPDPLLSTSNAQSVSMNRRKYSNSNTINSASSSNSNSNSSSNLSSINSSIPIDYEAKTCQFCNKQFAHKGSLGRHLDFKKGDPWHPIDQVNLIRINTSRRNRRRSSDISFHSIDENNNNVHNNPNNNNNLSSNSSTPVLSATSLSKVSSTVSLNKIPSNSSLHSINNTTTTTTTTTTVPTNSTTTTAVSAAPKKRRLSKKSLATSQMSSDSASGQKEKSKLRRKLRDRRIKAKILTNEWFQDLFANEKLPDYSINSKNEKYSPEIFVRLVALYLPVNEWPINSPPDESYLNLVINRMKVRSKSNLINLLNQSFEIYKTLKNNLKFELWNKESIKILKSTIGKFSICDLYEIKSVIAKREQANFEEICRNDQLSEFVEVETISTPNVEIEQEEDEEDEEGDDEVPTNNHSPEQLQLQQQQLQQQQPQLQHQHLPPPPPQQHGQHTHNSYISQIPEVQHPHFEDFGSSFDKFY